MTGGDAEFGGGIRATSSLVFIEDAIIMGNEAEEAGGGIYVESGSLKLTRAEVSGNSLYGTTDSTFGAGIRMVYGDVEVTDSDIFANAGEGAVYGGGISIFEGDLELTGTSVDENEATMSGGGIALGGGWVYMTDSRIRDNVAGEYGGGVKVSGGLDMTNSVVRDNEARINGGGAYVAIGDGGDATLDCRADASISSGFRGNTTTEGLGGGVYSASRYFEIESDTCDWGAGESQNHPYDLRMRDWIGGASSDATFECNNFAGCDSDDDMWTRAH